MPLEPLRAEQIDAVLQYLPRFEAIARETDNLGNIGMWGSDPELSTTISAFIMDLYDLGVIQSFDWMRWERATELIDQDELLATASLEDIHKLLIGHVRFDRFAPGHFDEMVENGHIARILQRLNAIRAESDTGRVVG